jgi:hypothetical protein
LISSGCSVTLSWMGPRLTPSKTIDILIDPIQEYLTFLLPWAELWKGFLCGSKRQELQMRLFNTGESNCSGLRMGSQAGCW